jgi:ABC-type multidrug transport system ATPase subunit
VLRRAPRSAVADELAIETRGLTRTFGQHVAVDRLDLAVRPGTVYGFLGPNGAGKTTTIRLLLGLLAPDSGTITIDGEAFAAGSRHVLRRIAGIVEGPSLYPHLTGEENVEVTRRLIGSRRERIAEVLELTGLTSDARKLVSAYSTGMKQRLALAIALLGAPRLLMLDEPANGLDPLGIRDLRLLLTRLAHEQGATVFLSSHALADIQQTADDVGIVQDGRLVYQGALTNLPGYGTSALEDIFLNVIETSRHP